MDANLRLRVVTAGVGIPLLIGLVGWSPVFVFSGFFSLLTLAALWEFYAMVFPRHGFGRVIGILSGFGLAQLTLAVGTSVAANLLVLALICVFAALLFYRDLVEPRLNRWSWTAIGGFYIGYLLPHLILLFSQPDGRAWVFWLFLVVMAGDSAAYFIGRRFGRRKLAPRLSPGKTVEGACGYVVGAVLGGLSLPLWPSSKFPGGKFLRSPSRSVCWASLVTFSSPGSSEFIRLKIPERCCRATAECSIGSTA